MYPKVTEGATTEGVDHGGGGTLEIHQIEGGGGR